MTPRITDIFRFKQFSISQTHDVFRVNTEAVLLAAWIERLHGKTILDIGSGTGVIGLALDFHFGHSCSITSLDVDINAYRLTRHNIHENNTHTVHAVHSSLEDFSANSSSQFDIIVSNPPFFYEGYKSTKRRNQLAKYTDSLSFEDLIANVESLLNSDGLFYVVIPSDRLEEMLTIAMRYDLHRMAHRTILPRLGLKPNRELLKFSRKKGEVVQDVLYIRNEDNQYSLSYIDMTRAFYTIFD